MANKKKYKEFVDSVRAKGGLKHYDLGGSVLNTGLGGVLTPQSGYQAGLAPTNYLNYSPAIQNAINTVSNGQTPVMSNIGQEQALASQLQAQALGQGPNPAQAALAQNTGTNVANQAALAAGQRGASSNVGLMQRNIAQQGASTQQQAVGQAATLGAQQQLAAQQNLAQQQGLIGGQLAQQQGIQNQLLGNLTGAAGAQNQNAVSNYGQAQGVNASTAAQNAQGAQKTLGGLLGGAGAVLGTLFADGGEVEKSTPLPGQPSMPNIPFMAEGGEADPLGPQSFAGKFLSGDSSKDSGGSSLGDNLKQVAPMALAAMNSGGAVPHVVEGEKLAAKGMMVPGKAKVSGNSLKNDTVPAMLSPGEVVINREIMQSDNPPQKAAEFVQKVMMKHGKRKL